MKSIIDVYRSYFGDVTFSFLVGQAQEERTLEKHNE
jgi:hypothetical protein